MPERPRPQSPTPEADFTLDLDQVFIRPSEPVSPAHAKTEAPRNHYKLERKSQPPVQTFGHFAKPSIMTPEKVSLDPEPQRAAPDAAPFGKKKHEDKLPELTPNRAYEVMRASSLLNLGAEGDPHIFNRRLKMVGLIALFIIGTLLIIKLAQTSESQLPETAVKENPATAQEARITQATQTLKAYLSAKNWKDKLAYILDAEKLTPRFREYYTDQRGQDPAVSVADDGRPQEIGGKFWFGFNLEEAGTKRPITARLQETPKGFRLDWENFIQLGALPWPKFNSERPQEPTQMRVSLTPSKDYAGAYADPAIYQAFTISHLSGPPILTGYVERASRAGQSLDKATQGNLRPTNLNLYLRFAATDAATQVKIIDMVSETAR